MRSIHCAAVAALAGLLGFASSARAEPDGFYLGDGHSGAGSISAANTVINTYAAVTAPVAPGDTSVSIGTARGTGSFAAGDLVLLWQATGVVPEPPSGQAGPFDVGTTSVGHWELVRLNGASAASLSFTAPVLAAFPAMVTQAVRVPEYTTLTLNGSGSVQALGL